MEFTEKNDAMLDVGGEICVRAVQKNRETAECSRDFILPDLYADIKKIISYSGSISPESSFVDGSKAVYGGTLNLKVLFIDDESRVRSALFSQDYSGNIALTDEEGYGEYNVISCPVLESISVRMANPRKLSVRGRIDPGVKVWKKLVSRPSGIEVKGDNGERCEVKIETSNCIYPFSIFCGDLEINEDIRLDSSVKEIAFCDAKIDVSECIPENDRVNVKGSVDIDMIGYSMEGSEAIYINRHSDFSQTVDVKLPDSVEDSVCCGYAYVRSIDFAVGGDPSEGNNKAEIDIGYGLTVAGVGQGKCSYISDAYLPTKNLALKSDTIVRSENPEKVNKLIRMEACTDNMLPEGAKVLFTRVFPHIDSVVLREGIGYALGDAQISVVYKESDGIVSCSAFNSGVEVELGEISEFDEYLLNKRVSSVNVRNEDDRLCVGYDIDISLLTWKNKTGEMVSSVTLLESSQENKRKPFTVCYPAKGDQLWDIGKKYGVSIDSLKKANPACNETSGDLPNVILVASGK